MQVALQRVFVEGTAQPGTTPAQLRGNLPKGVEPLELVAVQMLLHVEPESQLWWRMRRVRVRRGGETREEKVPRWRRGGRSRFRLRGMKIGEVRNSIGGRRKKRDKWLKTARSTSSVSYWQMSMPPFVNAHTSHLIHLFSITWLKKIPSFLRQ